MTEAQILHCPSCGGPLDFKDGSSTLRCQYCSSTIIVPDSLRRGVLEPPPAGPEPALLNPVEMGNLRLLIANGRKIEAIKRLRQLTDLSLKQAKEVADALERGEPVNSIPVRRPEGLPEASEARLQEIHSLVQQDRMVEAVRLMRETADVSLHDARILVESLRQGESTTYVLQMLHDMQERGRPLDPEAIQPQWVRALSSTDTRTVRKTATALGAGLSCSVVGFIAFILAVILLPIMFGLTVDGGPLAPLWSKVNPFGFAGVDMSLKGEGIAPGEFNDPRAVAVDQDGNIYVSDFSSGRLQSFNEQGRTRWLVNLANKTIIQSLDISASGVLFAVAQGDIRRFQLSDGKELEPFPNTQDEYYYEDLYFGPDGRMAVIANSQDLLVYSSEMQLLFQVPQAVSSVTGDSELDCDVALDALGNIFILGHFNNKVLKFSPQGKYINQFGGETTDEAPGRFRAPGEIAVDFKGRVYVSDIFGVQVFEADGQYIARFKLVQYAFGMDFDSSNQMYIASNEPQVMRLTIRK